MQIILKVNTSFEQELFLSFLNIIKLYCWLSNRNKNEISISYSLYKLCAC